MKKILVVLLIGAFFSLSANAYRVECTNNGDNDANINLRVEVRNPFVNATLFVTAEGESERFYYPSLFIRGTSGFYKVEYYGAGFNLEVDMWPDRRPQFGRRYDANLETSDLEYEGLQCSFY